MSPCPFPTTITITPQAPPLIAYIIHHESSYLVRSVRKIPNIIVYQMHTKLWILHVFSTDDFKQKITKEIKAIIIIIKACQQYGFLWLSLIICSYHPPLLTGPLDSTQWPHWVDECKFLENIAYEFVSDSLKVPNMSWVGWFVRWEVSDRTAALLWSTAFVVCSKLQIVRLCSSH